MSVNFATVARQVSAGGIVGLSAVIYAVSYGALLFSGSLTTYVGYGIAAALVTAGIGALFGLWSEERTFICGPDSNTISVLAAMLSVLTSLALPEQRTFGLALATLFLTSMVCALAFYATARFKLAGLVRYIPFSVMAGFLASTGWLMCSGALNIVTGTPLSIPGLEALLSNPQRPELLFALGIVVALYGLASRVSGSILIPLVILVATVIVNLFLFSGVCSAAACQREVWMFAGLQGVSWQAPWDVALQWDDVRVLLGALPSMLVVSFVGLLTILLSLASLELSFRREFDLNRVLNAHAASTGVAALLGGFVGVISIGRTSLNKAAGGGGLSGVVAAMICIAILMGAGGAIGHVPKAALGGLVLYLGLNMLKQWLWDQRKVTSRDEIMQILLIVVLVANYGYLIGFVAGVLISCMIFVLTYSRVPLASLTTNLSLLSSSVVRLGHAAELLGVHGEKTIIYRLQGYMFFGSASKIDMVFQEMNIDALEGIVLDFTGVSGIDRSAIGVFQRILRRYRDRPLRFYFVYSAGNRDALQSISAESGSSGSSGNSGDGGDGGVSYFPSLDHALETAEEHLLGRLGMSAVTADCFAFLDAAEDREAFRSYCEAKSIGKDAVLCRDGEFSDAIYFVDSGCFDVVKRAAVASDRRLARVSEGAMMGEMAFYSGEARTASICAVVDSRVYVLHKDALQTMRARMPGLAMRFDHMVIEKLTHSLTRANKLTATFG